MPSANGTQTVNKNIQPLFSIIATIPCSGHNRMLPGSGKRKGIGAEWSGKR